MIKQGGANRPPPSFDLTLWMYSKHNLNMRGERLRTIASISADNANHLDQSYKRESNQFNENQNIENTVYCCWGGGNPTLLTDPSSSGVLSKSMKILN